VTEERDRVLAEDLELAIKAMSEGGEEFEFRWLIPQGLSYRSHQFWADGSSKEQFHGLSEREFGTILKATIAAAREQGAATVNEYLNDICDAYEAWEKACANGPGAGITDEDYPGPSDAECAAHDEEVGSLWFALGEAIERAAAARVNNDDPDRALPLSQETPK